MSWSSDCRASLSDAIFEFFDWRFTETPYNGLLL